LSRGTGRALPHPSSRGWEAGDVGAARLRELFLARRLLRLSGEVTMATKTAASSDVTLRGAVTRIRHEGKQVIDQVDHEVRRLAKRARSEFLTDSEALRREVSARVKLTEREIERRVGAVEAGVRARLGIAGADDVARLARQVESLERRLVELTEQIHDALPAARG
jgi:hypothetical protein